MKNFKVAADCSSTWLRKELLTELTTQVTIWITLVFHLGSWITLATRTCAFSQPSKLLFLLHYSWKKSAKYYERSNFPCLPRLILKSLFSKAFQCIKWMPWCKYLDSQVSCDKNQGCVLRGFALFRRCNPGMEIFEIFFWQECKPCGIMRQLEWKF